MENRVSEAQFWSHWLEGQKQGFAGKLPRHKLADGSKLVGLCELPLLYTDRWVGSDLGGGQTIMYLLSQPWDPSRPSEICGIPLARMGYSGQIAGRLEADDLSRLAQVYGDLSQSDIVWKFLKQALSCVTLERPLRGPILFTSPQDDGLVYTSIERGTKNQCTGHESIRYRGTLLFEGVYDFTFVKKNLEDNLF